MKKPAQPRVIRLNLSEEERPFHVLQIEFQERTIRPIVRFFTWTNSILLIAIFVFAMIEHFFPQSNSATNIITDKVIIAAIGGISVQAGAILIAAVKGLFSRQS